MNRTIRMLFVTMFLSLIFAFNAFAMREYKDPYMPERRTPENEVRNEDKTLNYYWTWVSDDSCVQFRGWNTGLVSKENLKRQVDLGLLPQWAVEGKDGAGEVVKRETYSGKWSQDENGVWSFLFDDKTIPVGVTKIDDVLYAFNGYGELQDGLIYYGSAKTPYDYDEALKTGADGVVNSDNPDFLSWLETQYVPACTSHE